MTVHVSVEFAMPIRAVVLEPAGVAVRGMRRAVETVVAHRRGKYRRGREGDHREGRN